MMTRDCRLELLLEGSVLNTALSQHVLVLLPLRCTSESLCLSQSTCSVVLEPQGVERKVAGHTVGYLEVGVACGEVRRKGRRLEEGHA